MPPWREPPIPEPRTAFLTGAFIGTVWAANWALTTYGVVAVGFGLAAPAGVFFAGLAFTLRDGLHEVAGRRAVLAAIVVGATLSAFLEDGGRFALASGVAFGLSELADLAVYTPLRRRGWFPAVVASNVVGFTLDSVIFLGIAFGSLAFLEGQLVGKAYMTAAAVVLVAAWRHRDLLVRLHPA